MTKRRILPWLLSTLLILGMLPGCRETIEPKDDQEGGKLLDHYRTTWASIRMQDGETLNGSLLTTEAIYFSTSKIVGETEVLVPNEDVEANEELVTGKLYEYEYNYYRLPHGDDKAYCLYTTSNDASFSIAPDGDLWLFENNRKQENGLYYIDTYLKKVSVDGTVEKDVQIAGDTYKEYPMGKGYRDYTVSGDGRIFFREGNIVYWVDEENLIPDESRSVTFEEDVSITLSVLPDGQVQVECWDAMTSTSEFFCIDPETAILEEGVNLWEGDWSWVRVGKGARYPLLRSDGNFLYGEDVAGTRVEILCWADFELTDMVGDICVLEDSTVLTLGRTSLDETAKLEFCRFTPCTAAEAAKRVTVSGYGLDEVRELARQFNKTQSDYIVRVKDYLPAEIINTSDYEKAMTQLNTELLAGDVPDIVSLDEHISANLLAAQGALEDLYPHVDKDVGRDFFVDGILQALESDGALYQLPTGFSIETMVANREVVGDLSSLTFDQLKKLEAAHPETDVFHSDFSRDRYMSFLNDLAAVNFVDWSAGECTFDNGQFAQMLEMAKTLETLDDIVNSWRPDDELITSSELLRQGRLLLSELRMTTVLQFYNTQKVFGEKSLYIGFPTAAGTGNLLTTTGNFAIMKGGQQKEGAWQFLCWMVKNYGETVDPSEAFTSFPAERAAFERCVAYYQNPEKGYVLTAADVAKLTQLIRTATPATVYDPQIAEIIDKEASYFFAGKCTAQKAAANIQSRVQLYVMEQM